LRDIVRQIFGFPGGSYAADDVIFPHACTVVCLCGMPVAIVTRDDARCSQRAEVPDTARVAVATTCRRVDRSQLRTHYNQQDQLWQRDRATLPTIT